jgi:hypothetical protein
LKKLPLLVLLLAVPVFTPSQVPPAYEISDERDHLRLIEMYLRNQPMNPELRQPLRAQPKMKPAMKEPITKNAKHSSGRNQNVDTYPGASPK